MSSINIQPKLPAYDPKEALRLYLAGQHVDLCKKFISALSYFRETVVNALDPAGQFFVDSLMHSFLYIFSQPDFGVPSEHLVDFVRLNRIISNLAAASSLKTTDAYLEYVRPHQGNYVKILTLYSARNTVHYNRNSIFDVDGTLGSVWYVQFGSLCFSGVSNPTVVANLKEHFNYSHPKLTYPMESQDLYFGSTYVDGECDRVVKERMNGRFRDWMNTQPPFRNRPNPRKIAVMSTAWVPTHSVYRTLVGYVQALRPKYHVTFFQLGNYGAQDTSLFDEWHNLEILKKPNTLSQISDNDFQAVFLPDIGMCLESIVLANSKIAPIQILGTGHPVSTFGSEMNYFLTGADVEIPDSPERNYSERLLMIPGMGAIHNKPLYTLPSRPPQKRTDRMVINCLAFCQKVNAGYAASLRKILAGCRRKTIVRFFVGASSAKCADHLALRADLARALGAANIEVYAHLTYDNYMGLVREGDITVDSYHFGGSNITSDSLFVRVPIISWEGTRWYNRIGPRMQRLAGLGDCVTNSEAEFVHKVTSLLNDDAAREALQKRVAAADLDSTIYSTEDAKYFRKGLDFLIENHERIQADPNWRVVRIERD